MPWDRTLIQEHDELRPRCSKPDPFVVTAIHRRKASFNDIQQTRYANSSILFRIAPDPYKEPACANVLAARPIDGLQESFQEQIVHVNPHIGIIKRHISGAVY